MSRKQRERTSTSSLQSDAIQRLTAMRQAQESRAGVAAMPAAKTEDRLLEDSDYENEEPVGMPVIAVPKPLRRLVSAVKKGPLEEHSSGGADSLVNALQCLGLNERNFSALAKEDSSTEVFSPAGGRSPSDCNEGSDNIKPSLWQAATLAQPLLRDTSLTAICSASGTSSAAPPEGTLVLGDQGQYVLPAKVASILYTHQLEGIKWLWSLHMMKGKGGILGDDMGLGKTLQCAAFLSGLLTSSLARHVLVIAPKTLIAQWAKELEVAGLGSHTHRFYGDSTTEREAALRAVLCGRGVLLTTYGMVLHHVQKLCLPAQSSYSCHDCEAVTDFKWDYMLLDEGHKVKNPKMKLVQELRKIPAFTRVIVSGTPIQNNLMELHALMDFCAEGVLGTAFHFKHMYEKIIVRGQSSDASTWEREKGAALATRLRQQMAPYFLRREKSAVMAASAAMTTAQVAATATLAEVAGGLDPVSHGAIVQERATMRQLGRKNDLVVWLRMRPLQEHIYRAFLESDAVKEALNKTKSALAALVVLKKIADHPGLLSKNATSAVIKGGHRWSTKAGGRSPTWQLLEDSECSSEDECDGNDSFIDDSFTEEEGVLESESIDEEGNVGNTVSPGYKPGKQASKKIAKSAQKRSQEGSKKAQPTTQEEAEEAAKLVDGWASSGFIEEDLLRSLEAQGAEASCKTAFVLTLLGQLTKDGHRTLIFSQSRIMLDILQAGLEARGMKLLRIDGSIVGADDREGLVQQFQKDPTIPVMLLTSQVGGLGLTLTEADRVIICDPNWNPAIDNQSVDRAYRIGQRKDVVVYRLITCGTVEEKIYRRQIFKVGLSRTGTEDGVQFRYFKDSDLADLFSVTNEGLAHSHTRAQLHELHARQRNATPQVLEHLAALELMDCYDGISDHDLLFSNKASEELLTKEEAQRIADEAHQDAVVAQERACEGARSGRAAAAAQAAAQLASLMSDTLLLGASAKPGPPPKLLAARKLVDALAKQLTSQQMTYGSMNRILPDGGKKMLRCIGDIEERLQTLRGELEVLEAANVISTSTSTSGVVRHTAGAGLGGAAVSTTDDTTDRNNATNSSACHAAQTGDCVRGNVAGYAVDVSCGDSTQGGERHRSSDISRGRVGVSLAQPRGQHQARGAVGQAGGGVSAAGGPGWFDASSLGGSKKGAAVPQGALRGGGASGSIEPGDSGQSSQAVATAAWPATVAANLVGKPSFREDHLAADGRDASNPAICGSGNDAQQQAQAQHTKPRRTFGQGGLAQVAGVVMPGPEVRVLRQQSQQDKVLIDLTSD